jgi:hypothetical protein
MAVSIKALTLCALFDELHSVTYVFLDLSPCRFRYVLEVENKRKLLWLVLSFSPAVKQLLSSIVNAFAALGTNRRRRCFEVRYHH